MTALSAPRAGQAVERMTVVADDGTRLHAEVVGNGPDLLFLHEFSGDHRSWSQQVQFFNRRYRCITFAARGFPGSDVPADPGMYSQARAAADALCVLDAVGSVQAHLVGMSMGAFTALNVLIGDPGRVSSVVAASCGYGADVDQGTFQAEMDEMAQRIRADGCEALAELTGASPYRQALASKDPAGFAIWKTQLAEHDPVGQANTIQGVQRDRPTLLELLPALARSEAAMLFVAGDEDDPLLAANVVAKQRCRSAGLVVLPRTAHTVNLEEPAAFNSVVLDFLSWVEAGSWPVRDTQSQSRSGGWIR